MKALITAIQIVRSRRYRRNAGGTSNDGLGCELSNDSHVIPVPSRDEQDSRDGCKSEQLHKVGYV